MRNAARLVVVAALASAAVLPATSANAVYCNELDPVCDAICAVGERLLHAQCLD
jgi:hypothetical protein